MLIKTIYINNMDIPRECPSCSGKLLVAALSCSKCKTIVWGVFEIPAFAVLDPEDENLLKVFLTARGVLKKWRSCWVFHIQPLNPD